MKFKILNIMSQVLLSKDFTFKEILEWVSNNGYYDSKIHKKYIILLKKNTESTC